MNEPATSLRDGVLEIDTLLGGWEHRTAGYLITGSAPLLIETGSQSSVPVVKEALAALGIGPRDLAGIAVTHIHLDHAGGVGDLAAAFPGARVYVHELGARHLVDPSRLIASAGRVYGELLDGLYGRLEPTPSERITVLGDNDSIDIGDGRQVLAINSPQTRRDARAAESGGLEHRCASCVPWVRIPLPPLVRRNARSRLDRAWRLLIPARCGCMRRRAICSRNEVHDGRRLPGSTSGASQVPRSACLDGAWLDRC